MAAARVTGVARLTPRAAEGAALAAGQTTDAVKGRAARWGTTDADSARRVEAAQRRREDRAVAMAMDCCYC